jgi:hypothetical protein
MNPAQNSIDMLKRVIVAILGGLGVVVGFVASAATVKMALNSGGPASWDITMCSMALVSFWFGYRLLQTAWLGKNKADQGISRFRTILLGIGCFIPGFVFSLPLTMMWASSRWPGDGQAALDAFPVSLVVGAITAIVSCIVLLWRRTKREAY